MTPEEMVAIRLRDEAWDERLESRRSRHAPADRRALILELDRVRALWDECRDTCFDRSVVERGPSPD